MKVIGIIAEFNPFHKGHEHLINETKSMFPGSPIVVVMSGNAVQRGEFAIYDKFVRTQQALEYGVDLVIELPTYYTLNNANIFAEGAIKVLSTFGITDLVFGSESNNYELLLQNARKMNTPEFQTELEALVKETQSYPAAFAQLIGGEFKSNDTLGMSYLSEIEKQGLHIKAHTVHRVAGGPTASAIREELRSNTGVMNMEMFWDMFRSKLLTTNSDDNLIKYLKNSLNDNDFRTYKEFLEGSANKTFTKARISRELVKWILEIEAVEYSKYRVLGASETGLLLIKGTEYYNTGFSQEYKNELKVSSFINLVIDGYKESEIDKSIIIFKGS